MNTVRSLIAFSALGLGLAACGGNNNTTPTYFQPPTINPTTKYVQIERLSRPAIKEVFENFVDHQKSNAIEPYQDDLLKTDISATEDFVRYGSATGPAAGTPDYGPIIQSVVYPDEYAVDLSQTAGGFLGYELAKNFGGRAPNDDVIATELSVLFGTGLSDNVPGVPPDNKSNNCLKTQNLAALDVAQQSGPTFPYLPVPR